MSMTSQMDIFQQFLFEENRRHGMELSNPLTAILDYLQYLIRTDFNVNDKATLLKKNRKGEINKEFRAALTTLNREQKIYYYCMVVTYMNNFITNNFAQPKSSMSGMLNAIGFSRSFNIKRWKQKKLRFDIDKHIMFAEREQKIKSYDIRNYILRRSKNKDYHCFVLEAINNVPHQKSMTVHIGFTSQDKLSEWWSALRFSVCLRQWQFYRHIYQISGQFKTMSARSNLDDHNMSKSMYVPQKPIEQEKQVNRDFMSTSMMVDADVNQQNSYQKPIKRQMIIPDNLKTEQKLLVPQNTSKNLQTLHNAQSTQISQKMQQKQKLENEIKAFQQKKQLQRTYVDELIDGQIFQQPDVFQQKIQQQEQVVRQHKKHLDLFHKLYPEYELQELEIFANFEMICNEDCFKIYQHTIFQRRIKMFAVFDKDKYSRELVLSMISKSETSQLFNQNIDNVQLKTFIPSENSAVMYQLNKAYNRLYRARDYVFLRHAFSVGRTVYMVDKSIQYANYPPFLTIVRGSLCNVYGIFQRSDRIQLIVDFQMRNQGLLNPVQQSNLTLKYIKGYKKMFQIQIQQTEYELFRLDWDISKNKQNQIQNQIRTRRKTLTMLQKDLRGYNDNENQDKNFKKNDKSHVMYSSQGFDKVRKDEENYSSNNSSPVKKRQMESPETCYPEIKQQAPVVVTNTKKVEIKRFDQKTMEEVGELKAEDIKKKPIYSSKIQNQLDKQGMVIIRSGYRTHHYPTQPFKQYKLTRVVCQNGQHPVWKQDWIRNQKQGGLLFINKPKLELQKGVLSFVLKKIAKNLFTGQSPTTISLPVDIFSTDSNLQRFLYSFTYAPLFLQGLGKQNLITRLVRTVAWGISSSILYLNMEKPFNPILGETFQCWVNGCPAYAEQISHHPPIAALLFKGRGYQITGSIESVVNLSLNSGTGVNDGIYSITFQDGIEINFMSPGGEVSGLTSGDRKFNLVNKSYYWIRNANIMIEVSFDPYKKGVFSFGKQQKPADYFQGTIWQVKPQFMQKFIKGKRKEPQQKERLKDLGKISGIWNQYILFNGAQVFSPEKQYPVILEYENYPLPSDSNWRQDIEYRRRLEIPRAQTQKQRLEVLQRKDRKLREKYKKKK